MNVPKEKKERLKKYLLNNLKEENVFWSYDRNTISSDNIDDDQLIALTLRHLDLPDIKFLFSMFSKSRIHKVWRERLVPEGEYLYTLNRFLAWYCFKSKRPDQYLKSLQTRHLNKLLQL